MQWFGPRRGGMVQKMFGPSEGRGKRAEKREKREERDKHDQDEKVEGCNGSVPGRRDGTEHVWSLGGKQVEGCNGSIPEWRDGTEKGRPLREKRQESREKREERREKRETSTTKISRLKYAMARSQNGGMVQNMFGP